MAPIEMAVRCLLTLPADDPNGRTDISPHVLFWLCEESELWNHLRYGLNNLALVPGCGFFQDGKASSASVVSEEWEIHEGTVGYSSIQGLPIPHIFLPLFSSRSIIEPLGVIACTESRRPKTPRPHKFACGKIPITHGVHVKANEKIAHMESRGNQERWKSERSGSVCELCAVALELLGSHCLGPKDRVDTLTLHFPNGVID